MVRIILACYVAIVICVQWMVAVEYITVPTKLGNIEGFGDTVTVDGETLSLVKFLGVPYAESTEGSNRFQKPIPKAPFKTKYSALSYPPSCYQVTKSLTALSEDCLFMNIYVPYNARKPLPVMIWIHGGAFLNGAASSYKAEAISAHGNVIVVTINYRLEMFGFLRSKDGGLIGNQGLWDQHLAIKWVHDNIASFTGDPNEVTIFGESAGSASVLLQALYPGNMGLFKRVIAESGAALAYWAVTSPKGELAIGLSGCSNASNQITCLRELSPLDLQSRAFTYHGQRIQYTPSVDNDFLLESPQDIIYGNNTISDKARAFFASLDILTGVNSVDGAYYMYAVWPAVLNETFPNIHINLTTFLNVVVPLTVQDVLKPRCQKVRERLEAALRYEYTPWSDPNNDTLVREQLLDLSSDIVFFTPAVNTVQGHSRLANGRTYLYEFALDLPIHTLPTPSFVKGSSHADEIAFVFGYPISNAFPTNVTFTEQQKNVSRAVLRMWTNFAKTSDPNWPMDVQQYTGLPWPQYTKEGQGYLQFTDLPDTYKVKQGFQARRMAFWLNYLPSIMDTQCS